MFDTKDFERMKEVEERLCELEKFATKLGKKKIKKLRKLLRSVMQLDNNLADYDKNKPSIIKQLIQKKPELKQFRYAVFHIIERLEKELGVEEELRREEKSDLSSESKEKNLTKKSNLIKRVLSDINGELEELKVMQLGYLKELERYIRVLEETMMEVKGFDEEKQKTLKIIYYIKRYVQEFHDKINAEVKNLEKELVFARQEQSTLDELRQ